MLLKMLLHLMQVKYCSAWPKSKLNTKIGLHTTTHHHAPTTHHHKLFYQKGLPYGFEILRGVLTYEENKFQVKKQKMDPRPPKKPNQKKTRKVLSIA
jgi:hypothetical protein